MTGKAELFLTTLNGTEIKILFDNHIEKSSIFDTEIAPLISRAYWFVKVEIPELIEAGQLTELVRRLLLDQGAEDLAKRLVNEYTAESPEQVKAQEVGDILGVICWVRSQLLKLVELEARYLASPPDPDRINAGVKELDKFGELNVIRAIAKGNILIYDEIKKLPYSTIFDELYISKTERDIETRLAEIKKNKNKPG